MEEFKLSCNEKAQVLESELMREIVELKNEIEEAEMLHGQSSMKAMSSVSTPMSHAYFRKERELTIHNALQVSGAKALKSQGQVMVNELEATLKSDLTDESLPLLLHQFYNDRLQSMVQCKHLHMLRWRRFCEHTDAIERLYPAYRKRLDSIDEEYADAKKGAQRLSAAHHAYVLGEKCSMKNLRKDDLAIFFRWLVCHLHSTKKFCAFLKLIEWVPIIHKNNIDSQPKVKSSRESSSPKWPHMSDISFLSSNPSRSITPSRISNSMAAITEQAFSGFVSNEATLSLPTHSLELHLFREQLEFLALEYEVPIRTQLSSSADEMELFGAVNRKFKNLLNKQEECNLFYQYDNTPEGFEHWGVGTGTHCLKKPANWLKHVRIKPRINPMQLQQMTTLKENGKIDELLRSQNKFFVVGDFMKVTESLKRHAVAVRDPPTVQAVSVSSHRFGGTRTVSVWQKIYENSEKTNTTSSDESGDENVVGEATEKFGNKNKQQDSYDYANTMQMLGLDEGDDNASQDPTVIQGAYLSFLHLRHLKIRDMRRQCLALLNYFRSVERTITIYDGGFSLETEIDNSDSKMSSDSKSGKKKRGKSSNNIHNERAQRVSGSKGRKRGIGSHHFVHNTPADFKIDQNRFMEFGGVENHDDFYTLDYDDLDHGDDGDSTERKSVITAATVLNGSLGAGCIPHVQDQRGYFVVYDVALKDFRRLEKELLLVASKFLEQDVANRSVHRRSSSERAARRHEAPGEVDIASYGHRDVDRFAVVLDAWTCELNFLLNKRKLLDCYLEAYHHTFDPNERQGLAQAITDVMHQRPRYDFTQEYFVRTYKSECACLKLRAHLLTQILTSHLDDCRQYLSRIARPYHLVGLPLHTQKKQEIALNLPKPALKHVDMMEFHPTLGPIASRFPEAVRLAINELQQYHRPTCMSDYVNLEKQVLEHIQREWDGFANIGGSFTNQIQRDVFSGSFAEDPILLNDLVQSLVKLDSNEQLSDYEKTENDLKTMTLWRKGIEMVLLRHRLIESAWETEILARLYKQAASEMGFEEYHMYLRLVQFEFANKKDKVDIPPSMMTSFIPDDLSSDRYTPPQLLLAINEMDENHIPKFSFRSREMVLQFFQEADLIENLRISVACQISHKNALIIAVTQARNCAQWKEVKVSNTAGDIKSARDASETRSSHSVSTTMTQATARSGAVSPGGTRRQNLGPAYSGKLKFGFDKQKSRSKTSSMDWKNVWFVEDNNKQYLAAEAFISIQLEKTGPRDVVVNAFIHKKETSGMMLRKPGEVEKLKRSLVADYCREVSFRMNLYALRSQIISCYSNMMNNLERFPSIRDKYFLIGQSGEQKRKQDDVEGMIPDPRVLRRRPKRVISPDGKNFLNLWFVPHFTEIMMSHRNLDYENQHNILMTWLTIVSSLHDIMLYLCAHTQLGNVDFDNNLNSTDISADWGGKEGIGAELSEIQQQIDVLSSHPTPHTKDPAQVAELLSLRRETCLLSFDTAVRCNLRETFLATDRTSAFQSVSDNIYFALPPLTNVHETNLTSIQLNLPEVLEPGSKKANELFPWLSFQSSNGQHPTAYSEYWDNMEHCVQLCLAGLNASDKKCANGEILGVSLLLEEVLLSGTAPYEALSSSGSEMAKGFLMLYQVGKNAGSRPGSGAKGKEKPSSPKKKAKQEEEDEEEEGAEKEEKEKEEVIDPNQPLSKLTHPIQSYKLMNTFMKLRKQLEILKEDWGRKKLQVQSISTTNVYREFQKNYRAEVLLPVYSSIARQFGRFDEYNDIASDDQLIKPPVGAPVFTVDAAMLIKLLELLECSMISDVRQQVARELTLVLAERSREESALPTELWSHPVSTGVRENFTINRPHIVEDFVQRLLSESETRNGDIIFNKKHLNSSLSRLASDVMQRERENYESYSVYYENILRHHHHLLYMKELELKAMNSKHGPTSSNSDGVVAQFQLADRSHELLLEITALRAKITEMREQSIGMEQDVREEVRSVYQDLVENLFEMCFQMKAKLAQCHLTIHDDVRSLIAESREEAMKSLGKLKNDTPTSTAEERLKTINIKEKQIETMQHKEYELNTLLTKLNALHHWKRSTTSGRYKVTVERLIQDVNRTRRDCLSKQMVSKQEASLLKEELESARKSLEDSHDRLAVIFEQIDLEKRIQKEREHRELQEERNRRQLAHAQRRDMERLMVEVKEKDKRLQHLSHEADKNAKLDKNQQAKVQRNLKQMHTQLSLERNLKLDAFDRVDCLQAQALESEREVTVHSVHTPSRPASATLSLTKSAVSHRSRPQSSFLTSPNPATPRPRVRPMSSVPASCFRGETPLPRKRPQTASGRLKNKIAAALLTEIYPSLDEHETVIQLDRINA